MVKENSALMAGTVRSEPSAYMCCGESFWAFDLEVFRYSGTADVIPVNCPKLILESVKKGDKLSFEGQLRSYARTNNGVSKLYIVFFVLGMHPYERDINEVSLEGYICDSPHFKVTSNRREICYSLLAVNRGYRKSDYIPQVFWGRTARRVYRLKTGNRLSVIGRLQSRTYTTKDGKRTVYEVSASQALLITE